MTPVVAGVAERRVEPDAGRLNGIFQTLADPTSGAGTAAPGSASVGDLAKPFDMALPSLMPPIRSLEQNG